MRVEFAGGAELSFDARGPRKFPSPFGARHSMRVFMDGYLPSEPVSVLTDRSRPSQNVEFLLDPDPERLAYLELEVVDDAGTPLNRVIIYGSTGTFVKPHQVLELSNGRTDLKFLPGSYGFVLGATGVVTPGRGVPLIPVLVQVVLKKGERQRITATLQRGGWVRVHPGARIAPPLYIRGVPRALTPVREGGAFLIVAPPGTPSLQGYIGGKLISFPVDVHVGEVTEISELPKAGSK